MELVNDFPRTTEDLLLIFNNSLEVTSNGLLLIGNLRLNEHGLIKYHSIGKHIFHIYAHGNQNNSIYVETLG